MEAKLNHYDGYKVVICQLNFKFVDLIVTIHFLQIASLRMLVEEIHHKEVHDRIADELEQVIVFKLNLLVLFDVSAVCLVLESLLYKVLVLKPILYYSLDLLYPLLISCPLCFTSLTQFLCHSLLECPDIT